MRSLTPTEIRIAEISHVVPGTLSGKGAVDPESDAVFVPVQRVIDGVVEVDVIRIDSGPGYSEARVIGSFQAPGEKSELLDLHYFSDDRTLVLILKHGDIAIIATEMYDDRDSRTSAAEVVGSVESGILAAAWSPDEETLVLVTGDDNLVTMTRSFDLLHEEPLRQADFGEDKFVNVGWGSKTTQFHGSLGKAAAKAPEASSSSASRPASLSHPTDSGEPVISFRGDAAFFAVSSLDPYPSSDLARRQIRIYSSPAGSKPNLSATSELLPGLEGPVSWRPSGNVISSLIRYGYEGGGAGNEGRWEVAMLERNGLRHGGFPLREAKDTWEQGRVKWMTWNCDSEVLAICVERIDRDVVQLWTMKNYHYYLKQEIFCHEGPNSRLTGVFWHTEKALTLYLVGEATFSTRTFVWDTYASHLPAPRDTAAVAVVDGDRLLVTPFRTQNTPPPMSSYQLSVTCTPVHVAFSPEEDALVTLHADGTVQRWDLKNRLPDTKQKGGKAADPVQIGTYKVAFDQTEWIPKQIAFGNAEIACLLDSTTDAPHSRIIRLVNGAQEDQDVQASVLERLLSTRDDNYTGLHIDGQVVRLGQDGNQTSTAIELPAHPMAISVIDTDIVHLAQNGKLVAASLSTGTVHALANGVTSFTHTPEYIIYTTASQSSHYVPTSTLDRILNGEEVNEWEIQWETRAIERGALAVTACQSSMSLILQMPRGNLETVYPRPLVLAVVRRNVASGQYRDAFITCRKHRLDLNLLHDLDPEQFIRRLGDFVDQVQEVDYLNLFVSSLKDDMTSLEAFPDLARRSASSRATQGKLNRICDAIRGVVERRDLVKYTETILSTHVCKQPPDYEGGLSVLLRLQTDHPDIVQDAVKYIIFLSNVNQLYDVALGMYDFQLVLMIAQYSQKDPQEYLPFLKELRALDDWERKYRVDDHLARHEKALRHLHSAGPSKFQDSVDYLGKYELYDVAFELYSSDAQSLAIIQEMYGDHLFDRRDYNDAALAYMLAAKTDKAMKAYERAHAWRDLLALAVQTQSSAQTVLGLVDRCSDYLATHGRHVEAAQLMLDYTKNVEGAVNVLCAGHDFSEALRVISLYRRADLIEAFVHPGLEEAQESFLEAIEEMQDQLDKEVKRLSELKIVREDDPDAFYMVDAEPNLEGVDVATNATTVATAFTRYTAAPTTAFSQSSRRTGRTDRSRNRASRKRPAGRKGSVDEYEYLVASIGRLVIRAEEKSKDALPLLRHLILASPELRELAADLQNRILSFRSGLADSIDIAWLDRKDVLKEAQESGGMGYDEGRKMTEAWSLVKPVIGKWAGVGTLAA
ncbi:IKI3 family-domain-containing protein [Kockovaella imperatae]|uniref:Elongator complex protein 1 n=1 Tax=Kockovaella imperatae TaxID=4999 RepID=A0A1Y1UM95_9TREE|nr:IKI3 family-domain-containing protein [Kockovaella imperatae]ORX39112.1 IKI3 family-domain-containing protein [Kockovaella imperatae]